MLRFIDGCNHYSTSQMERKWTSAPNATIGSSTGRNGNSIHLDSGVNIGTADGIYVTKTIDNQATWIIGFAFKTSAIPTTDSVIIRLKDAGSAQIELKLLTDGTFRVLRNSNTLGTTTYSIGSGSYHYIELKITIHNSTGTVDLHVDGVSRLSLTGQDTQDSSNATVNEIRFQTIVHSGTASIDYCDIYICDSQGSTNNDFLGDVRIETLTPNGNGNSSQFVGSDSNSTDNYLLVDNNPANDDTDYVESSTVNDKDLYSFSNLSTTPSSIKGIQINIQSRKTDGGTRTLTPTIRSNSTDYDQTNFNLSSSYLIYTQVIENDPNTSAAWTASNLNSAEFGMKLIA